MPSGATGTNNFYEDPMFVDPGNLDFNLMAVSSCIDTGIAFFVLNGDTLVDMSPAQYFGPAPDVGAFEFDDGSGFEGSAGPFQDGIGLYRNSPNPFCSETAITYQLSAESFVSIEVYDLSGRSVMTLVEAEQAAGSRSLVWNGRGYSGRRLPSGTYIVRLQTNSDSGSIKVLLID